MRRIFGKDGPVLVDKNIGRAVLRRKPGKTYVGPGRKELARALRRVVDGVPAAPATKP